VWGLDPMAMADKAGDEEKGAEGDADQGGRSTEPEDNKASDQIMQPKGQTTDTQHGSLRRATKQLPSTWSRSHSPQPLRRGAWPRTALDPDRHAARAAFPARCPHQARYLCTLRDRHG
jgi:hypothetical protein